MDKPVTESEVRKAVKLLKNKKAAGFDEIRNECQLKSGISHLSALLVRLFNFIIPKGTFPDSWSTGMITPIFKSGNRSDPSNYRGFRVILPYPEYKIKRIFSRSEYFTLFRMVFYADTEQQIISLFWWDLLLINMLKMKTEINCSVVSSTSNSVWLGMAWWFTVNINTQQNRLALFWPSLRYVLKIKVCHPIWW